MILLWFYSSSNCQNIKRECENLSHILASPQ